MLEKKDEDFSLAVRDVARRMVLSAKRASGEAQAGKFSTEAEVTAARDKLIKELAGSEKSGAPLSEAELEPLLAAMACRTPDTAVRGARGLAQLGDARALGALLQLSREPEARHPPAGGLRAPGAAGSARP